ncbi:MAG: hypothetical protein WDO15_21835 [Bacteroidota bacterium]
MDRQLRLRLFVLIPIVVMMALSNLHFYWTRIGGWVISAVVTFRLLLFAVVAVAVFILFMRMYTKKEWRSRANYGTMAVFVLWLFIRTSWVTEDSFQAPAKLKACYEGTMNSERFILRQDGTFEEYNVGFAAYVHYWSGTWKMSGDTIHLSFERTNEIKRESTWIIKPDSMLYPVHGDSVGRAFFYLGDCKGLN